jgi:DNA-binding MarR family transcriptional regulator
MDERRQSLLADVGLAMQRYQRSVQAFDDAVGSRLGLGPADLRCLDWLADGPKSAGELATATGLKPAATTALIDRLAGKGLVERVRDDHDRRRVLVQMTAKGAEQTGAFYQPLVEEGQQVMQDLQDRDLSLMRDLLALITDLTDRHRSRLQD